MLTASALLRMQSGSSHENGTPPLKETNGVSITKAAPLDKTAPLKETPPRNGKSLVHMLHVPVIMLFTALMASLLLQYVYQNYVTPIVMSYKRGPMVASFYNDYRNEFTYYNRHCSAQDVSTTNSNDLLITPEMTSEEAADVMLEHGAVAFQNILDKETSTNLRTYLADKHAHRLHYNEVFWQEINRLSLALGTHDDPAVAAALEQVGKNEVLKKTLEGILGEDPAIVEVSTLSSMAGSNDQNIHSDSDWFGSSLLYGQSFLHSYSMFIALQDTTEALGATTVCPGAHFCADIDLEEVCLDNGAFSVSTNGKTGDEGMLYQGDAFLFNQNIWHRGPGNRHQQKDRIMFILTFASSNKQNKDDLRRQALGTYYYQRWNMWGHTFADLKIAATRMVQPWGALRALGLLPAKGITWIHHFAQQLANGDDFYDGYVLMEFKEKILEGTVPTYLQSDAEDWEEFILETMQLWVDFLFKAYAAVAVPCTLLGLLMRNRSSFAKTSLVLHGLVCVVLYGLLIHIKRTELGQSVETGHVMKRPFAEVSKDYSLEKPTTLPERHDVLFSSRLEPGYLASFTRFLDFHPGNKRWRSMVDLAATELPSSLQDRAVQAIVHELLRRREAGLPTRFLQQDYATGYWQIMTEEEALEETRRLLKTHSTSSTTTPRYAQQLQYDLAKARFSHSEPWMASIFMEPTSPRIVQHDTNEFQVGDQIWAYHEDSRGWFEAILVGVDEEDENELFYDFFWGGQEVGYAEFVRPYVALQSGDRVTVDYHGNDSKWFQGTIMAVHPDGSCAILYDDGEYIERVKRESILLLSE